MTRRVNIEKLLRMLVIFNGFYYVVTGLWPLIDIRSFMLVTGPKVDLWLVKMVGLLAASTGISLLYSGFRRDIPRVVLLLAVCNAVSFAAIDCYYVIIDRIAPVYLADALTEIMLIAGYLLLGSLRRSSRRLGTVTHGTGISD